MLRNVPNNSLFTLDTTLLSSAWGGAPRTVFFLSPNNSKISVEIKKKDNSIEDGRKKFEKKLKKGIHSYVTVSSSLYNKYCGTQTWERLLYLISTDQLFYWYLLFYGNIEPKFIINFCNSNYCGGMI